MKYLQSQIEQLNPANKSVSMIGFKTEGPIKWTQIIEKFLKEKFHRLRTRYQSNMSTRESSQIVRFQEYRLSSLLPVRFVMIFSRIFRIAIFHFRIHLRTSSSHMQKLSVSYVGTGASIKQSGFWKRIAVLRISRFISNGRWEMISLSVSSRLETMLLFSSPETI